MFCGKCGKENVENAKFCSSCGTPLLMETPVPQSDTTPVQNSSMKKSNTGLIIGIVLVFVFLMLGVAGVVGWITFQHITKALDETGSFEVNVGENVEDSSEEYTDAKTEEAASDCVVELKQLFEEFVTDDLVKEYGIVDLSRSYIADFENREDSGYTMAYQQLEPISGIVTYRILDFDQDNQEEMFVVRLLDNELFYQMYEAEDEKIVLQDERKAYDCLLAYNDRTNWNLYMAERNGQVYLIENNEGAVFLLADGATYSLCIMHYENDCFVMDADEGMGGSEFSDMEETIRRIADKVSELGFSSSAKDMDYELKFKKDAEDAQTVLRITGFNAKAENYDSEAYTYYETYNPEVLGTVSYHFYDNDESIAKSTVIDGYDVEEEDYTQTTTNGRKINAYFEYPVFKGENTDALDWINSHMKIWADQYKDNFNSSDYLNELQEWPYDEDWDYQPTQIDSVYYDQDYVSVALNWFWYMGGVANSGWKTANFDLKNMRYVTLSELMGKDWDAVKADVLKALKDEYDITPDMIGDALDYKFEYNFSFDQDTIKVYFESYELNMGGSSFVITLPRNN